MSSSRLVTYAIFGLVAFAKAATNTTHTSLQNGSEPSGPDRVSWQNAFGALVPIALNSMTQQSYFDGPSPLSTILYPSRISPFVCIADIIHAVGLLVLYMCRGLNFFQAAEKAAEQRCKQPTEERGRNHRLIRVIVFCILFLFGALQQAIKPFGFKGVPLTQLWAGAYLSSFAVILLLDLLVLLRPYSIERPHRHVLRHDPPYDPSAPIDLSVLHGPSTAFLNGLHGCALVAHLWLAFWIIGSLLGKSAAGFFVRAVFNLPGVSIILSLCWFFDFVLRMWPVWLPVIPFLSLVLCVYPRYGNGQDIRFPFLILWILGPYILEIYALARWISYWDIVDKLFDYGHVVEVFNPFTLGAVWFSINCLIIFFLPIFTIISEFLDRAPFWAPKDLRDLKRLRSYNIVVLIFAFSIFLLTLLYYRFCFDPSGTVKPSWAEKLL